MIRVKRMKVKKVSEILFFDGRNIEEVRFLFTQSYKLKKLDTVIRELSLLPHPKLPNKVKSRYFKFDSPHVPRPVQRNIVVFDEEKKSQQSRPPAQYSNISREEKIDYYLALSL